MAVERFSKAELDKVQVKEDGTEFWRREQSPYTPIGRESGPGNSSLNTFWFH